MTIKNIIFDLGGVIINIDYHRTLDAFRKLGAFNISEVYTQSQQDSLFDDFDIGKIDASEFRAKLKAKLSIDINDTDFDQAWNAMLLDLPAERLAFIESIKGQYNIFLFSNTNEIHLQAVFEICRSQTGLPDFSGIFDREYYSHKIGYRKPHQASFEKILKENNLNPEETLFIDDSLQHVIGARSAGIHAIHLTNNQSITLNTHALNETSILKQHLSFLLG